MLKWLAKAIAVLLGVVVLLVGGTLIGARFADGPLEIIAGGPFSSGEPATAEPDWSFVRDYATVEFQLLDPPRSRTTWIVEHEQRLFIPSGYMTTWWGKIWKQWPIQAEADGRALLRVDGVIYKRRLVRVHDDPVMDVILSELGRKYGSGMALPRDAVESGYLWVFELVPASF